MEGQYIIDNGLLNHARVQSSFVESFYRKGVLCTEGHLLLLKI